jgi:hypothetical protein
MNQTHLSWLARALFWASGITSLCLSLYGIVAGIMFDYRLLPEFLLGISMLSPFPLFLMGQKSVRWSAILLVLADITIWAVLAFSGGDGRVLNPFEGLSLYYFWPGALMVLVSIVNRVGGCHVIPGKTEQQ